MFTLITVCLLGLWFVDVWLFLLVEAALLLPPFIAPFYPETIAWYLFIYSSFDPPTTKEFLRFFEKSDSLIFEWADYFGLIVFVFFSVDFSPRLFSLFILLIGTFPFPLFKEALLLDIPPNGRLFRWGYLVAFYLHFLLSAKNDAMSYLLSSSSSTLFLRSSISTFSLTTNYF